MSDMPVIDESNSNYVKLPYTLAEGVMATLNGVEVDHDGASDAWSIVTEWDCAAPLYTALEGPWLVPWQYAAERLRYRKGEPWCNAYGNGILREGGSVPPAAWTPPLHRLAAILCDDAEGFRVLHWCVTNLGGNDD